MTRGRTNLDQIFERQIRTLALTLRPSTIDQYRCTARRFLTYLDTAFPRLRWPSQLRRDPHLLGYFRSLSDGQPLLSNKTRIGHLLHLRRLLDDLAANGHRLQPDLIRREDFPPEPFIFPDLFPRRRINSCGRNYSVRMISTPMHFCSSALRESASVNASACPWTACGSWQPNSGHSMSHSANCTRNAWFRPIPRCGGS